MSALKAKAIPVVNAHRGSVYHAVENTREAFEIAISHGATSLELDVVRLASGELVVFHGGGTHKNPGEVSQLATKIRDPKPEFGESTTSSSPSSSNFLPFSMNQQQESQHTASYSSSASSSSSSSTVPACDPLDNYSDTKSVAPTPTYSDIFPNTYYIEEMTLDEVSRLKFSPNASGLRPLLATTPPSHSSHSLLLSCKTAAVPLLADVLELCKANGVHIALEMKGFGIEHDCLRMVESAGMLPLVTFSSFHPKKTALIRRMRRDMSTVKTGKIFDTPLPKDWIKQTKRDLCNEAHICFADCTPQNISLAHANNVRVMGWFPHPINTSIWSKYTEDAALYETVAKSGVDVMCVNKPKLLREVLDRMIDEGKFS